MLGFLVLFVSAIISSLRPLEKGQIFLQSLSFFVKRVLAAELAVFLHFKSVRIVLFVFGCVIVSLLAFCAGESDFDAHFGTSCKSLRLKKASVCNLKTEAKKHKRWTIVRGPRLLHSFGSFFVPPSYRMFDKTAFDTSAEVIELYHKTRLVSIGFHGF